MFRCQRKHKSSQLICQINVSGTRQCSNILMILLRAKRGQEVKISLTAYDAAKYGRIDGLVSNISADAIANNETGEQYYSLDVKITGELPVDNDEPIMILPGMVATVEVLSGRRTILEYFWQPLVKSKDIAFRE